MARVRRRKVVHGFPDDTIDERRMNANLPLADVRVVEFSHTIMGPACGVVLADLGATVVKVEAPEGEPTRRLRGFGRGFFAYFNRNKESVALDLKSSEGREIVERLIAEADVLVENYAPGTMERLGFGYEALAKRHPRLVYCTLKGFMPGPYEDRVALDEVVQMMSGLAYMTGLPGQPLRAGASITDILGGTFGVVGILAALHERERTGRGGLVRSALFETAAFLMGQHMAHGAMEGLRVPPMVMRSGAWAVYDAFTSSDGTPIFIGVTTDRIWTSFCEVFERPDFAADPKLRTNNDRLAVRAWLKAEIAKTIAELDAEAVMERCRRGRIAFAPIAHPQDLFGDPHLAASNQLAPTDLPDGSVANLPKLPLRIGDHDLGTRTQAPELGDRTHETLARLGYEEAEIARLRDAGLVVWPQARIDAKSA